MRALAALLFLTSCSSEYRSDAGVLRMPEASVELDGGADAAPHDGGFDAASPATAPTLRWPVNGAHTGSIHVADTSPVADHPLRPKLMWERVVGAVDYHIQMDESCPRSGFRACSFASPEVDVRTAAEAAPSGSALLFRPSAPLPVSTTAPVGAHYVWRVRACSAGGCGGWSEPRYLEVGRHEDDFNGDGYADLVVGTNGPDETFVYYGGPDRLGVDPAPVVLDTPIDEEGSGAFGRSVASAGDIDGDGYADLVVGASTLDDGVPQSGKAFVYYGGPDGFGPDPRPDVVDHPASQVSAHFGGSVAGAGDLDGDGYADIVIAASLQGNPEAGEGNAYVYYGDAGGLGEDPAPDVVLDNPADQPDSRFGVSVANAGDLDGDGYPDLVVGAFTQDNTEPREGNAFVYYGDPSGLGDDPDPDVVLDNPADQVGGHFGLSGASAGDLDGDGYADLVLGAEEQDNTSLNEGNAFVYYGGPGGLGADPDPDVVLDNPTHQVNGNFGYSVASAGDLDGDGYADLVIGALGQHDGEAYEGHAFVYYGGPGGLGADPDPVDIDNPADQAEARFGCAVASAGDLDGDGYADLVVGAYWQDNPTTNEGNAFVYYGGPGGLGADAAPDVVLDNPSDQWSGEFGISVASAGDHLDRRERAAEVGV